MPSRRPGGSSPSVALDRLFDRDSPLSYEERLEALISAALPDQVPRLSFGAELARGGMGSVRLAFDEVLQRRMAAKTMHARTYEHLILVHGFLREAQVTGQLDHPNIVPIHELGRDEQGQLYFTMKLVEGQSLKAMIAGEAATDHERLVHRLEIFVKVCDALSFAHSRGVIHCDLKSANVMVGAYGQVYLMDWGGAQLLPLRAGADESQWVRDALPPLPQSETDGLVFGTPSYMSPEQAMSHSLDERSDVFSMGALLYEVMTGKPPYHAKTAMDALLLAQHGNIAPPDSHVAVPFPRELVRIVMKALRRDPDDRYASVAALQQDIVRLLRGSGSFQTVRFAAGDHVIREGEIGDAAYIVLGGRLEVYKLEGGHHVSLRWLGPGDVFGETSIFAASRRTASVLVVEEATLTKITSDLIEEELTSMKPWMGAFVRTLAARFAGIESRTARMPLLADRPSAPPPPRSAPPSAAPTTSGGESVIIDIDEPLDDHHGASDMHATLLAPRE
ncbi:serine/threonine-protein kinase [Nannocystis sp. SCPEA4]|uniref:serine/threonine-protein kinase n=1 Tax=Nannocystis sp. SCPEA4 TaxID=2996787 RepID=UPI00226EFABC|nr:serine/threonine-protein kinase [Nannocystis sp. SCPEA4]MCY1063088.1 serine/threonine-protein kinase [Nannocystis sp. SCPEA4]